MGSYAPGPRRASAPLRGSAIASRGSSLAFLAAFGAISAGCGAPQGAPEGSPSAAVPAAAADPAAGLAESLEADELLPPPPPDAAEIAERLRLASEPWTGDFDGMLERRIIRALVVPSKTYYFVENGRPRGVSYEVLHEFENELNRKLGTGHVKVHVVFIPVSHDELMPLLLAGRGDIASAGLTITPGRLEQVDFTVPTGRSVDEIAVTGPASPEIATIDDLAGKEVFVRPSSSFWEHLEELNRRFAAEGKEPVVLKAAPEELENEDLLEMLNAGLFGITFVDDFVGELWAKVLPEIRLHPEIAIAKDGEIGMMIRKGSPKLEAELDAFVATHGKGSAFGNTVARRYLDNTQFVKSATSPEEIAKYRGMVDLFHKYGEQYTLDHLLMMAQGYQESRLDQSARSHVGAIGVMQIMPATAQDLAVGDVAQLEPNIHGGVKYMRWMIDNFYADEPMTELDKALFAFASYNAGPGRLRQLRRETAERGLDPNVWFQNVELVAADRIGAETVTYVSNIFKYAVAYRLVAEADERRRAAREAASASTGAGRPEGRR